MHQAQGLATNTRAQHSRDFVRWQAFLTKCGVKNKFLDRFHDDEKVLLMSAFAASIRNNENGKTRRVRLHGTTVRAAISNVCSAFRSNLRRNPILESGGEKSLIFKRQIQGYINEDPVRRHQKCLPMGVFRKLYSNTATPLSIAIGQLTAGALFFGMRSCEYSSVTTERKTKILTVRNIRFLRGNKLIKTSQTMNLSRATTVSICFMRQKNNEKEAVITMHRTKNGLCPVEIWGQIVKRILSYPKTSLDSPVNLYANETKKGVRYTQIKSTQVLQHIRNIVTQIGSNTLGFEAKEVGTHSIRSSFAMMLHVQGISSEKIMLQGRWRSTAFLTYLRVQVTKFSDGLSDKMIQNRDFYNVPDINYDVCRRDLVHADFDHIRRQPFFQTQPGIMAV